MAVVVEQTTPFDSSVLDLENPTRWNTLFPLIRPTVQAIRTSKGQDILVDTARASSHLVHVAAIASLGNFSSKFLDERNVTAIITEQPGSVEDVVHAIQSAGVVKEQGIVIVKAAKKRDIRVHGAEIAEVDVKGELEADHLLHLLGNATESCRASMPKVVELLTLYIKSASTATSSFHTAKVGDGPAVLHAEGAQGFAQAKHAVHRDLKAVLSKAAGKAGDVFSVHYSDINGLSRLENYILAKNIAEYFGESRFQSAQEKKG